MRQNVHSYLCEWESQSAGRWLVVTGDTKKIVSLPSYWGFTETGDCDEA